MISWNSPGSPDPNDPRILPASMQFTLVHREEKTFVQWNIAEGVPLGKHCAKTGFPYIVRTLLSPSDARMIAQQLLEAAEWADGGPGLPDGMEPPEPPPPPPSRKA